jgi:sensor c-di-GMP phosphodiesterase-like protein
LAQHKYWNEQGEMVTQNTVPAPYIPTPAVQATLNQLLFPDLVTYDAFAAMCNQVTSTDASFQNCMYDAAAVPDFITQVNGQNVTKSSFPVAASNGMATNVATLAMNPPTQTITTTNNALALGLGIGLGGAALIALVIAVFYWNRYRFVDSQYSKALIQLNGGATKGTKGEGRSAQAEIRLEDNL